MPSRFSDPYSDLSVWGLVNNDAMFGITDHDSLYIVANRNNPPTIKAGTNFFVYNIATTTTLNEGASGNNVYPANTLLTYEQPYSIFELADEVLVWGTSAGPTSAGTPALADSTQYYLFCTGSQDVNQTSRGKGIYGVDTNAPSYSFTMKGWYNVNNYKVIASFQTDPSGNVINIIPITSDYNYNYGSIPGINTNNLFTKGEQTVNMLNAVDSVWGSQPLDPINVVIPANWIYTPINPTYGAGSSILVEAGGKMVPLSDPSTIPYLWGGAPNTVTIPNGATFIIGGLTTAGLLANSATGVISSVLYYTGTPPIDSVSGFAGSGSAVAYGNHAHISGLVNLGDILYGGVAGATTKLSGNTEAVPMMLTQLGTGAISAVPSWSGISPLMPQNIIVSYDATQTNPPDVLLGTAFMVNGSYIYETANRTFTWGSTGFPYPPSGSSTVCYLYCSGLASSGTNQTGTYLVSTTAPTWNGSLYGWYNGANICIARFYATVNAGGTAVTALIDLCDVTSNMLCLPMCVDVVAGVNNIVSGTFSQSIYPGQDVNIKATILSNGVTATEADIWVNADAYNSGNYWFANVYTAGVAAPENSGGNSGQVCYFAAGEQSVSCDIQVYLGFPPSGGNAGYFMCKSEFGTSYAGEVPNTNINWISRPSGTLTSITSITFGSNANHGATLYYGQGTIIKIYKPMS